MFEMDSGVLLILTCQGYAIAVLRALQCSQRMDVAMHCFADTLVPMREKVATAVAGVVAGSNIIPDQRLGALSCGTPTQVLGYLRRAKHVTPLKRAPPAAR